MTFHAFPPLHEAFFNFEREVHEAEDNDLVIELGIQFLTKIHELIETQEADPSEKYQNVHIRTYIESEVLYADSMLSRKDLSRKERWIIYRRILCEALDELSDTAPNHSLHALYDEFIHSVIYRHIFSEAIDYVGTDFLEHFTLALECGTVDLFEERNGVSILERLQAHSEMDRLISSEKERSWCIGYCQTAAELLQHEQEHMRLTEKLEAMMMGNHIDRLRQNSSLRLLPLDMIRNIATEARSAIPAWPASKD